MERAHPETCHARQCLQTTKGWRGPDSTFLLVQEKGLQHVCIYFFTVYVHLRGQVWCSWPELTFGRLTIHCFCSKAYQAIWQKVKDYLADSSRAQLTFSHWSSTSWQMTTWYKTPCWFIQDKWQMKSKDFGRLPKGTKEYKPMWIVNGLKRSKSWPRLWDHTPNLEGPYSLWRGWQGYAHAKGMRPNLLSSSGQVESHLPPWWLLSCHKGPKGLSHTTFTFASIGRGELRKKCVHEECDNMFSLLKHDEGMMLKNSMMIQWNYSWIFQPGRQEFD